MIAATYDIEHRRGDVLTVAMRLKFAGGDYIDLTGATVRSQAREDFDSPVVVDFDVIIGPDQTTFPGALTLGVAQADADALVPGLYGYDIEVTIDGEPETYVTGSYTVTGDYTHD